MRFLYHLWPSSGNLFSACFSPLARTGSVLGRLSIISSFFSDGTSTRAEISARNISDDEVADSYFAFGELLCSSAHGAAPSRGAIPFSFGGSVSERC